MANNRMILMCGVCRSIGSKAPLYGKPTKSGSYRRAKGIFVMAKWYPSSGWYVNTPTDKAMARFIKRLNKWLDRHRHEYDSTDEYRFRLEYEC